MTIHYARIENSIRLRKLLDIMKDADGPMTTMEIQKAAEQRGFWTAAPATEMNEIAKNPGYTLSGGVRFPDGKFRYWLIDAPGWRPRWKVTPDDLRVVPVGAHQEPRPVANQMETGPRTCKNPGCRRDLPPDQAHTCDAECNRAWKDSIFKPEPAVQGSLL